MKLVGFTQQNDGTFKEHLPHNEQLSSDIHKRAIFFSMFNTYMDKSLHFSRNDLSHPCSIEETFRRKIYAEINVCCVSTHTPTMKSTIRIDIASSLLIHAYFLGARVSFPLSIKPFMRVGKFISLLYSPSGLSLMLDLDDMFLHLVYERIKKVNADAEVFLFEDSIVIKHTRADIANSLIIPSYRKIEKDKLFHDVTFKKQMDMVQNTLNAGDISNVYLVYPKHPNFKKYINITLANQKYLHEDDYKVKIMPYSFSFCAKGLRSKETKPTKI